LAAHCASHFGSDWYAETRDAVFVRAGWTCAGETDGDRGVAGTALALVGAATATEAVLEVLEVLEVEVEVEVVAAVIKLEGTELAQAFALVVAREGRRLRMRLDAPASNVSARADTGRAASVLTGRGAARACWPRSAVCAAILATWSPRVMA
jgi:hypothetical protein